MTEVTFTINGGTWSGTVANHTILVDLLRNELGLSGTRIGCDHGACGACTILMNGMPVAACSTFAFEADGADLETIEGLAGADGSLHPLQQAFLDAGVAQCGYCTGGMILLAKALLDTNPHPSRAEIRDWMGANICRCTGYQGILDAIARVADQSELELP